MNARVDRLKQAVEGQYGGTAVLMAIEPVKETVNGKTGWKGVVHVYGLDGHPEATRAYAWSSPVEGTGRRRFYAVLHLGGIRSPLDALRAAMMPTAAGPHQAEQVVAAPSGSASI